MPRRSRLQLNRLPRAQCLLHRRNLHALLLDFLYQLLFLDVTVVLVDQPMSRTSQQVVQGNDQGPPAALMDVPSGTSCGLHEQVCEVRSSEAHDKVHRRLGRGRATVATGFSIIVRQAEVLGVLGVPVSLCLGLARLAHSSRLQLGTLRAIARGAFHGAWLPTSDALTSCTQFICVFLNVLGIAHRHPRWLYVLRLYYATVVSLCDSAYCGLEHRQD